MRTLDWDQGTKNDLKNKKLFDLGMHIQSVFHDGR